MLNADKTNTRRYAFYPDGKFEVDEEQYPGQYDPMDLTEIEFSYEMHDARTLCTLQVRDKKFVVIVDAGAEEDSGCNMLASSFLLSIIVNAKRIEDSPLTETLYGTVVVIEVH